MLVAQLVVGFGRRYSIADGAMWFDERFTLMYTESVSAAVDHCFKDAHPPLYFVFVALWRVAFPSTEFSMRLLSLIFGMASITGIFLAVRVIAGGWADVAGDTGGTGSELETCGVADGQPRAQHSGRSEPGSPD